MNVICLFVGHHRSRRDAVEDSVFGWRSVCERCGTPMVRIGYQKWQVDHDPVAADCAAPEN